MPTTIFRQKLSLFFLLSLFCLANNAHAAATMDCTASTSLPAITYLGKTYPVVYQCKNTSSTENISDLSISYLLSPVTIHFRLQNNSTCKVALASQQSCIYSGKFTPQDLGDNQLQLALHYQHVNLLVPTMRTVTLAPTPAVNRWYVSFGMGIIGYSKPNDSTGPNATTVPNYPASSQFSNNSIDSDALVNVNGGYEFSRPQSFWLSANRIGLLYRWLHSTPVNGQINYMPQHYLPNNNPIDYKFNYNFASQNLFLADQEDIFTWHGFSPFISVGIGIAANTMSDYEEYKVVDGEVPRPAPMFADHTLLNFAWQAGGGLAYHLTQDLAFQVVYNYSYLGNAAFGDAQVGNANTIGVNGPSYNNIHSNDIDLNILYLFPG